MSRASVLCLVALLVCAVNVSLGTADGVQNLWNEVGSGLGTRLLDRTTVAEDALRVLRSVPLTQLSSFQRRHVKRRILAVLGLDHVPRPVVGRSLRGRRASVASYMMALYRGGGSDLDGDEGPALLSNSVLEDWTNWDLVSSDWNQLTAADTVISFANQGR